MIFPSPGEDGKVFFCPRGGQFWRYRFSNPKFPPLRYKPQGHW